MDSTQFVLSFIATTQKQCTLIVKNLLRETWFDFEHKLISGDRLIRNESWTMSLVSQQIINYIFEFATNHQSLNPYI